MIGEVFSKRVPTTEKRRNGWVTKKLVIRTCDGCGITNEVVYSAVINRRLRKQTEFDYCTKCARNNRMLPKGENNKHWRHGLTSNGYKRVNVCGKRVLEHCLVAEEKLGRPLEAGENVHHVDLNKTNNDPANIFVFKNGSDHTLSHHSLELCGYQLLGVKIWFDFVSGDYVTDYVEQPSSFVSIPPFKLYRWRDPRHKNNTSYQRYHVKGEDGSYRWHKYHIYVAEKLLGRRLYRSEVVHHIDGNGLNNSSANLAVLQATEHTKCHKTLQNLAWQSGLVVFVNGLYQLKL